MGTERSDELGSSPNSAHPRCRFAYSAYRSYRNRPEFARLQGRVRDIAANLEEKQTIPMAKDEETAQQHVIDELNDILRVLVL